MSAYANTLFPIVGNRRNIQGIPTPVLWVPNPTGGGGLPIDTEWDTETNQPTFDTEDSSTIKDVTP